MAKSKRTNKGNNKITELRAKRTNSDLQIITQKTKYRVFSLNIFYLPIKYTKWIRHKLNKLVKSSPNYNLLN